MTRQPKAAQNDASILIVDDHPLFCDALELTLRSVMPNRRIKTADTFAGALVQLEGEKAPALIALDLNLPDTNGVDGVIEMRRRAQQSPIIVVSSLNDNRMISAVMAAGANGFVPKHSARGIFEDAIASITAGRPYLPASYSANDATKTPEVEAVERLALLTAQQARILDLICEGKLNKQIAYDLSIAETTVKAHITAIMRKLGVQSRTQAVLVAQNARFSTILPDGDN